MGSVYSPYGINDLLRNNSGQGGKGQYQRISNYIIECPAKPECHVLIWGAGKDSDLWARINDEFSPNGTTVFLEDNPEWRRMISAKYPHLEIASVRFPKSLRILKSA